MLLVRSHDWSYDSKMARLLTCQCKFVTPGNFFDNFSTLLSKIASLPSKNELFDKFIKVRSVATILETFD